VIHTLANAHIHLHTQTRRQVKHPEDGDLVSIVHRVCRTNETAQALAIEFAVGPLVPNALYRLYACH
jgi:hypothetical protein